MEGKEKQRNKKKRRNEINGVTFCSPVSQTYGFTK